MMLPFGILLIPIGEIDRQLLGWLRVELSRAFGKRVGIGSPRPHPDYAYHQRRDQYLSTAILKSISKEKEYKKSEKILGVVDLDLYVPGLNFVFGEASQRVAIISLIRLRQEFYGHQAEHEIFRRRVLTEAIHELGHTYGLRHCPNPHCVMFFPIV